MFLLEMTCTVCSFIRKISLGRGPSPAADRLGRTIQPVPVVGEGFELKRGEELHAIARATPQRFEQPRLHKQGDVVGLKSEHLRRLLGVQTRRQAADIQQRRVTRNRPDRPMPIKKFVAHSFSRSIKSEPFRRSNREPNFDSLDARRPGHLRGDSFCPDGTSVKLLGKVGRTMGATYGAEISNRAAAWFSQ